MKFEDFWNQIESDIIPQLKKREKDSWINSLRDKKKYLLSISTAINEEWRPAAYSHTWGTVAWYLKTIEMQMGISTKRLYDQSKFNWGNEIELES